jgi:hypothetical protein
MLEYVNIRSGKPYKVFYSKSHSNEGKSSSGRGISSDLIESLIYNISYSRSFRLYEIIFKFI